MGQFNGLLRAEFRPPKNWNLIQPLTYTTNDIQEKTNLWRMVIDLLNYNTKLGNLIDADETSPWEKSPLFNKTLIDVENGDLVIRVPSGFSTDLASVPRPLWWLIAPTDIARAAVIHDLLYTILESYISYTPNLTKQIKKRLRKLCDKVFYHAMLDSRPKVPIWKINATYGAVRCFGWTAIKGY
jgi:hypothetical protein